MNWPVSIGWILFLGVPLLLWLLGAFSNRGYGFASAIMSFVAGNDGRLSLSRMQAFLWTLVIFGSFFAAMAIHTSIPPNGQWVAIPPTVLALAGISVGSGVFSSLIAAVHSDQKTSHVAAVRAVANDANFTNSFPNATLPESPFALLISGAQFGDSGKVKLGRRGRGSTSPLILYWDSNGTEILIDLAGSQPFNRLTVETENGKLNYGLGGTSPNFVLGPERLSYEMADLFRDDKNPETFSLMKFQMFGWTIVAIFIYAYLFLAHLNQSIVTLPNVDSSIAVLTGVSQVGYLAGKGVSNVQPNT